MKAGTAMNIHLEKLKKIGKEIKKLHNMFNHIEIWPCDTHLKWIDDYFKNPIEFCKEVLSK